MAKITINLDVINTLDVVKAKKGKFTGILANLFLSEEKLKKEVETKVCDELVAMLKVKIQEGLRAEGVLADLKINVEKDNWVS